VSLPIVFYPKTSRNRERGKARGRNCKSRRESYAKHSNEKEGIDKRLALAICRKMDNFRGKKKELATRLASQGRGIKKKWGGGRADEKKINESTLKIELAGELSGTMPRDTGLRAVNTGGKP